jgi:CheY-like chemotaxis protein
MRPEPGIDAGASMPRVAAGDHPASRDLTLRISGAPADAEHMQHAGTSRPTVLVCDDEPVLRTLARPALGDERSPVLEACDGDGALTCARRRERPDLGLLDLMMPGRSGRGVLRELRSDPATAATPVIMLTARAQAADRAAMDIAGTTGYLTRPLRRLGLASLVEEVLAA